LATGSAKQIGYQIAAGAFPPESAWPDHALIGDGGKMGPLPDFYAPLARIRGLS